jgi:hypothetical protein
VTPYIYTNSLSIPIEEEPTIHIMRVECPINSANIRRHRIAGAYGEYVREPQDVWAAIERCSRPSTTAAPRCLTVHA